MQPEFDDKMASISAILITGNATSKESSEIATGLATTPSASVSVRLPPSGGEPREASSLSMTLDELINEGVAKAQNRAAPSSSGLTASQVDKNIVNWGAGPQADTPGDMELVSSQKVSSRAAAFMDALMGPPIKEDGEVTDRSDDEIMEDCEFSPTSKQSKSVHSRPNLILDKAVHPARRPQMDIEATFVADGAKVPERSCPSAATSRDSTPRTAPVVLTNAPPDAMAFEDLQEACARLGPKYRPGSFKAAVYPWRVRIEIAGQPFETVEYYASAALAERASCGLAMRWLMDQVPPGVLSLPSSRSPPVDRDGDSYRPNSFGERTTRAPKDTGVPALQSWGALNNTQILGRQSTPALPSKMTHNAADNVITALNNYCQKHRQPYPKYEIWPSSIGVSGRITISGRSFSTRKQYLAVVDAKSDLAHQGYKFLVGDDFKQPRPKGGSMASNWPATSFPASSQARALDLSHVAKLKDLADRYGFGSRLTYSIKPQYPGAKHIGELDADGQAFRTLSASATAAMAKEEVAKKALVFFLRVLAPPSMAPVAEFDAIKHASNMFLPGQTRVQMSGAVKMTINSFDDRGSLTGSKDYDIRAIGKLSSLVQVRCRCSPQYYETTGTTSQGEIMYACVVHWPTGKEVFGDLGVGFPDPKFARTAAAMLAIDWLEGRRVIAPPKQASMTLNATPGLPKGPPSGFPQVRPSLGAKMDAEGDGWQQVPRLASSSRPSSSQADSFGYDNGSGSASRSWFPSSFPVPSQGSDLPMWSNATSFGSKRSAPDDLFKENAPLKKTKIWDGDENDSFIDGLANESDYNRVEHVDGRFGF